MAKTTFVNGTIVTPEFLNSMYQAGGGHVHDGGTEDGHAPKIDLARETTGILPATQMPSVRVDNISDAPGWFGGAFPGLKHIASYDIAWGSASAANILQEQKAITFWGVGIDGHLPPVLPYGYSFTAVYIPPSSGSVSSSTGSNANQLELISPTAGAPRRLQPDLGIARLPAQCLVDGGLRSCLITVTYGSPDTLTVLLNIYGPTMLPLGTDVVVLETTVMYRTLWG